MVGEQEADFAFVEDDENFRYGEENKFNHQVLVMQGIKKCLDAGSLELVEGWWEDKVDKQGNLLRTYHTDTRKAFINSVKSLMGLTTCDFDEKAKQIIPALVKSLAERKAYWLNQEWTWWATLSELQRSQLAKEGKNVSKGFFNRKLEFDNMYYDDEAEIYRQIFTEINNLTSRLDFYGTKEYSA